MIATAIVVIIALAFGSFANNIISYFVLSCRFDLLRSTCFCGKRELKVMELVPLLSFVFQKSKCRECPEKIAFRYPLVEVITLLIGLTVYNYFGNEFRSFIIFFILYVLMLISVIDYYRLIIPNVLTETLLGVVVILLVINTEPIVLRASISFLMAFTLAGVQYFFKQNRNKEVLGTGDIKLIFVLSLLLNLTDSLLAIWISSIIGLVVVAPLNIKKLNQLKEIKIPFGLYLSIGFSLVFLLNLNSELSGLEKLITAIWQMKLK